MHYLLVVECKFESRLGFKTTMSAMFWLDVRSSGCGFAVPLKKEGVLLGIFGSGEAS